MEKDEPRDILDFAAALGVDLYKWQADILLTIEKAATLRRKKVAVRAPNGVGKTMRLVTLSGLRWLQRFLRGKVVVTSYDKPAAKRSVLAGSPGALEQVPSLEVQGSRANY
jgi:Rad3-related DNA helicase